MARYGILDLARAIPVRFKIARLEPPCAAFLLDANRFPDTVAVGPWIVDLERNPEVVRCWQGQGRWKSWGYIIRTDLDLKELRQHLRKFNLVSIEGRAEPVLFRYFDPEVLRPFLLDVADAEQRRSFLAPFQELIVEDNDDRALLQLDCKAWMDA